MAFVYLFKSLLGVSEKRTTNQTSEKQLQSEIQLRGKILYDFLFHLLLILLFFLRAG